MHISRTMEWVTKYRRIRRKIRRQRALFLLCSKSKMPIKAQRMLHTKVLQSHPDPPKVSKLRLLLQPRVRPIRVPTLPLHQLKIPPLQKRRMITIWIKLHLNLKISRKKSRIALVERQVHPCPWLTWSTASPRRRKKKRNRVNCPIKIS